MNSVMNDSNSKLVQDLYLVKQCGPALVISITVMIVISRLHFENR